MATRPLHPQVETYWGNVNPVGPRSCYDESKRFAEALTMAFHRTSRRAHQHRAHLQHLRSPHETGRWTRRAEAFSIKALCGLPLTVFGDGSQTRSFCYVSDLVDGLCRLMMSDERYPVNLGNPLEMTILEFAERIQRLTGSRSGIDFRELPEDDPKQRQPNISKAASVLGWSPKVDLEEELQRTVAYFESQRVAASNTLVSSAPRICPGWQKLADAKDLKSELRDVSPFLYILFIFMSNK